MHLARQPHLDIFHLETRTSKETIEHRTPKSTMLGFAQEDFMTTPFSAAELSPDFRKAIGESAGEERVASQ
jgi:hypothetical protein